MHPRAEKIGNTCVANETFVGSIGGAPSVTVTRAIVTAPAPIGDVAIWSVAVALVAVPSETTPAGISKITAMPDALLAVAVPAGARFASRNLGADAPVTPASTMFEAATPAFGFPAVSTSCMSSTPFAADGVT